MTWVQAVVIAVLQGATELFPVSSLGHAVVLPALLGWPLDQHGAAFLPFLVMLHFGTATALLLYFWRDWWAIFSGAAGAGDQHRVRESRHVLVLLVVGTIPAVILGGLFEHRLRALFGAPVIAAGFLVVNGFVLLLAEALRGRADRSGVRRPIATLSFIDALVVGLWQTLALFPGISRSGVTITGGLFRGMDHAASAHFSFLLATPIILAATVLEVPKLLHTNVAPGVAMVAAISAVISAIIAWLSTAFLMRYFRDNDRWALAPFALYCILAGAGSAAFLSLR